MKLRHKMGGRRAIPAPAACPTSSALTAGGAVQAVPPEFTEALLVADYAERRLRQQLAVINYQHHEAARAYYAAMSRPELLAALVLVNVALENRDLIEGCISAAQACRAGLHEAWEKRGPIPEACIAQVAAAVRQMAAAVVTVGGLQ